MKMRMRMDTMGFRLPGRWRERGGERVRAGYRGFQNPRNVMVVGENGEIRWG